MVTRDFEGDKIGSFLEDAGNNKVKFKDLKVGEIYLVLEGLIDDDEKNRKIQIIDKVIDKYTSWIKYKFLDEVKSEYLKEYEVRMYFTPYMNEELPLRKATKLNNTSNDHDMVNHPNHYNQGKYEVIDVIEDWNLDFNLGNAIKYIARCNHKGNKKQDLEKAIFYLKRELEKEE